MKILSLNFFVLQIVGFWRPPHWSSPAKIIIYNFYTCFVCLILYSATLSQLIEMIRSPGTFDDLIINSRVLLTMMNAGAKSISFIKRRDDILEVIDIITSSPCLPRNAAEDLIQKRNEKHIRTMSLGYGCFIQFSCSALLLQTAMKCVRNHALPFKSWIPYQINSELIFWLTYIHQSVAILITAYINICYDTIVPGCMVQTCAQLELFKSRLRNFCKDNDGNHDTVRKINSNEYDDRGNDKIVSDCVQHHLQIIKFAELLNCVFTSTIFIQFSISSLVISVSVYVLSTAAPFSSFFIEVMLYLMSMTLEIYVFCFYGNNVTVESSAIGSNIYDLDWVSFRNPVKKSLLIIMMRTMKPLTFTSGYVVVLSLASFTVLLKTSYSAYNVLQIAS